MQFENFERAKEIQCRMKQLDQMRTRLLDRGLNAYCISAGYRIGDGIPLSENMRVVLLGLCNVELSQLEEEFNEL